MSSALPVSNEVHGRPTRFDDCQVSNAVIPDLNRMQSAYALSVDRSCLLELAEGLERMLALLR
jgi:hypothetical protein